MTRLETSRGASSPAQGPGGTAVVNDPAADFAAEETPLRKAAILLVSLEQPLASQLLAQLDRPAVEAVTLEIARLERIAPAEQQAVLEEFYGLGLRRLRFVFDDLIKMDDRDIREAYSRRGCRHLGLGPGRRRPPRPGQGAGGPLGRFGRGPPPALTRLGPFRLDDAEAAQADVADRLRRLHDHGRLTLPDPNGQEAILV